MSIRILFVAVGCFLCNCLSSQTLVEGTVAQNTTWNTGGSPYLLNGGVFVPADVVLTVQPGVIVIFSDEDANLIVDGSLIAVGTSEQRIQFTGDPDSDELGGSLIFNQNSDQATFNHVDFTRLGSREAENQAAIILSSLFGTLDFSIINSEIHDLDGLGILAYYYNSCNISNTCFYDIGTIQGFPGGVAIYNVSDENVIARNCYWGSADGPFVAVQLLGAVDTEDFLTTCSFSAIRDLALTNVSEPSSACYLTANESVTITVANLGTEVENNFLVGYRINDGTSVVETEEVFGANLSPGESANYTFTGVADLSEVGTYELEAYVELAEDGYSANNSLTKVISYEEFEVEVVGPDEVCAGEYIYLQAPYNSNYEYEWNTGNTNNYLSVFAAETQTYSVTVTNESGCQSVATKTVVVNPLPAQPTILASADILCPGESVILTTAGGNVRWSTGATTPSITVDQGGFFRVTAYSEAGCARNSEYIYIEEVPIPRIINYDGGVVCEGDATTLYLQNTNFNSTYLWSTGATSSSIAVQPTTDATYSVTVTQAGCVFEDSFMVVVEPDVTPGTVGNLLPLDGATDIPLPVTFSWSPADNAASYRLRIGTNENNLNTIATTTQISYSHGNLAYGTTYCWQVVPLSCSGKEGDPSSIRCFTVDYLPDLIVQNVSSPTATAFAGAEIEVTWRVRNIGNAASPAYGRVDAVFLSEDEVWDYSDLYLGQKVVTEAISSGLGSFQNLAVTLPECSEGEYHLIVLTDYWNYIREEVEDNNIGTGPQPLEIMASPVPDLRITAPPVMDVAGVVQAGEDYDLNFTISNVGDRTTEKTFWNRIFIDSSSFYNPATAELLKSFPVSETLEPGENTGPLLHTLTIPEGLTSGEYFLHVVLDITNTVEECVFNGNNTATTSPFSLLAIPKPDFRVGEVTWELGAASNRQDVTLRYTLTNGEAPVNAAYLADRIVLNDTPDFESPIAVFTNGGTVSLDNGATLERERTLPIPGQYTGPLYASVRTNYSQSIAEVNYENNTGPFDSLSVQSPNLTPNSLTAAAEWLTGQTTLVTWEDYNTGAGALLNASYTDRLYLSTDQTLEIGTDIPLGSVSVTNTIPAGASLPLSRNVPIPAALAAGEYYLILVTNADLTAYENGRLEDNIESIGPITVTEGQFPDLKAQWIEPEPMALTAGESVHLTFSVENQGEVPAIGNWSDAIYRCTCSTWNPDQATFVAAVPQGQVVGASETYEKTVLTTLPVTTPAGSYFYYLRTNTGQQLYEMDTTEASNIVRSVAPVWVEAYDFSNVDLVLSNVEPPCGIAPGVTASVYYETRNTGSTATVVASWSDGIVLSTDNVYDPATDTLFVAQWTRDGTLAPGQSYANLRSFTLPETFSGTYYLLLVTDIGNATLETDRSNNAAILPVVACGGGGDGTITFPPKPDLRPEIVELQGSAVAGQPIEVVYRVFNESTEAIALGPWVDRATLTTNTTGSGPDPVIGQSYLDLAELAPQASYLDTLTATIPAAAEGNYFVRLQTDAGLAIAEEDENNNASREYLFVRQPLPADLTVRNVFAPPTDTIATDMTVSWRVHNIGLNPLIGVFRQGVYLSLDPIWDPQDFLLGSDTYTLSLNPFQETSFSLTGRLEGMENGPYYVIVRTDLLNNFPETEEENNDAVSEETTLVVVPEIVIDAPAITPTADPGLGLYYRIEVTENQIGESVRIELNGMGGAFNELYVAFDTMPTRTTYDFGFSTPFAADQEIVLPAVVAGTYYVLLYPVEGPPQQTVALSAKIIPFEITSVWAEQGGNTGQVTVRIAGGKFVPDMEIWLNDAVETTYPAIQVAVVNSTVAFVTFDLQGAKLGVYDVRGRRTDPIEETAFLSEGFEIVAGTIGNTVDPLLGSCTIAVGTEQFITLDVDGDFSPLELEKLHPPQIRPGQTVEITLRYRNTSNIDVPIPQRLLTSQNAYPLGYENEFSNPSQALNLVFPFEAGDQSFAVIPPGQTVSQKFYAKAEGSTDDIIKIRISTTE